jgi:hypothetical protein
MGRCLAFHREKGRLPLDGMNGTDDLGEDPSRFSGPWSGVEPKGRPASGFDPESGEFHRGEQCHHAQNGAPKATTVTDRRQESLGHEADTDDQQHLATEGDQQ